MVLIPCDVVLVQGFACVCHFQAKVDVVWANRELGGTQVVAGVLSTCDSVT